MWLRIEPGRWCSRYPLHEGKPSSFAGVKGLKKRTALIALVLTFLAIYKAPVATASSAVSVGATVLSSCVVSSTQMIPEQDTGPYPPAADSGITVRCTKGINYHISLDAGQLGEKTAMALTDPLVRALIVGGAGKDAQQLDGVLPGAELPPTAGLPDTVTITILH